MDLELSTSPTAMAANAMFRYNSADHVDDSPRSEPGDGGGKGNGDHYDPWAIDPEEGEEEEEEEVSSLPLSLSLSLSAYLPACLLDILCLTLRAPGR